MNVAKMRFSFGVIRRIKALAFVGCDMRVMRCHGGTRHDEALRSAHFVLFTFQLDYPFLLPLMAQLTFLWPYDVASLRQPPPYMLSIISHCIDSFESASYGG